MMKDAALLPGSMRHALPACLLAVLLLGLSGCSTSRPLPTPEHHNFCALNPGGMPPQSAPDDCLKEICREGRLERVEDLTETAPVSDWAEEGFCLFHPFDCYGALAIRDHVRQWEQDKARDGLWDRASLQGGLGDAARHAYLACLLTERYGGTFATGLLNAHEEDSTVMFSIGTATRGNRCCDKLMDLYNNRIGIGLAAQTRWMRGEGHVSTSPTPSLTLPALTQSARRPCYSGSPNDSTHSSRLHESSSPLVSLTCMVSPAWVHPKEYPSCPFLVFLNGTLLFTLFCRVTDSLIACGGHGDTLLSAYESHRLFKLLNSPHSRYVLGSSTKK